MFLCIDCVPQNAKWLFNLAMGISFGPCESCKTTGDCIDHHGNVDSKKDNAKLPDIGADRYDGQGSSIKK